MDLRIVIDSREQLPYAFGCQTVRKKLEAGDYSVEGFEHLVAVERKSLADFTHTVIHDFHRFAAELDRLAGYEFTAVVVETDLDAMLRGLKKAELRTVKPAALLGSATQISARWSVPVLWCGSRAAARAFTESMLRASVRELLRRQRSIA